MSLRFGSPASHCSVLLKQFNNMAVARAWARERGLVSSGFSRAGNWSPMEAAELLSSDETRVRGFETLELQSSEKLPQFARDGSNLEFVRVGQKTRKNRHGRRKHVAE